MFDRFTLLYSLYKILVTFSYFFLLTDRSRRGYTNTTNIFEEVIMSFLGKIGGAFESRGGQVGAVIGGLVGGITGAVAASPCSATWQFCLRLC